MQHLAFEDYNQSFHNYCVILEKYFRRWKQGPEG